MTSPVLVLVELDDAAGSAGSVVSALSLQALTFARGLGDEVHAAVVGELPDSAGAELASFGASVVHHAAGARLDGYAARAWATALVTVARSTGPVALVAASTARGNEVLAYAGAMLGEPMAANVVAVVPGAPWTATRQMWGGAALEELTLLGSVHLVTLAAHVVAAAPAPVPSTVVEVALELTDADLVSRVVRTETAASGGADLAAAKVVVGGGRGVGADGFDPLLELAALLGGTLGVSRVVTSQGWRPHHEQVGQTGTRIAPDLYIAAGISGAIQHMAGCQSAKTLLAINTDADAPMVAKADYAVIGDLHQVIPAITAEIRRRQP
jgi:electron transfer flavoprotein alpha subunit